MKNKHLTISDRREIERLLKKGFSFSLIGTILGRQKATISYEINRFENRESYNAEEAQTIYENSKKHSKDSLTKRNRDSKSRISSIEMQLDILFDEIKKLKETYENKKL